MISELIMKHRWFMKTSSHYLGYEDFTKAKRKIYPFLRAWLRFMWISRNDNHELYR